MSERLALSADLVEAVQRDIEALTELDICREGIRIAAAEPTEQIKDVPRAVRDFAITRAVALALPGYPICSEIVKGDRAVLVFSDAKPGVTRRIAFVTFDEGACLYTVILHVSQRVSDKDHSANKGVLTAICRSVLAFALNG